MPVYVTRAHVTIGDAKKKKKHARRGPIVPKHVFQFSDLRRTPYCFRTFFVTFLGFVVVAGGVVMTIIGYKPSILLPAYRTSNDTVNNTSESTSSIAETSAVPSVLGSPGPLRILVYIGPILMGLGVFSMMVAVVLFCEIKDRYFNNILPKTHPTARKKDKIYDKIISEFRKNYFRGIEVPLKPPQIRRRSKGRFSFSLSRSGSLASFGRRLSHDFQKKFRRPSRDIQTEKITTKPKRSSIRKVLVSDSWMKTSSLPNIRHKDSVNSINETNDEHKTPGRSSKSCGPTLEKLQAVRDANGVVNFAYRESPPDKVVRSKPPLTKHASLDTSNRNTHVTTVIVHRESTNDGDDNSGKCSYLPELTTSKERALNHSFCDESAESVINIDKDINLEIPNNELNKLHASIPSHRSFSRLPSALSLEEKDKSCTCGTETFCAEHASLGMDSGGSSLSLSWDNIPSEWNDARRNTEPVVFYKRSFNNQQNNNSLKDEISTIHKTSSEFAQKKLDMGNVSENNEVCLDMPLDLNKKFKKERRLGPFKTRIGVFKSDSNLLRVGTYSLLSSCPRDDVSLDSLSLTDEMLQNFDMEETAHI
ncbi:hypothetical protein ACF0H5_004613 [Mactra antiquata]